MRVLSIIKPLGVGGLLTEFGKAPVEHQIQWLLRECSLRRSQTFYKRATSEPRVWTTHSEACPQGGLKELNVKF
jgi:hypothetical protein